MAVSTSVVVKRLHLTLLHVHVLWFTAASIAYNSMRTQWWGLISLAASSWSQKCLHVFTCSRVFTRAHRAQELFGSRGGRAGLPAPISPHGLCGRKATFEEDGLLRAQELCESPGGRPGLSVPNTVIVLPVSVDVKQHLKKKKKYHRAQELCESRGGRAGRPPQLSHRS